MIPEPQKKLHEHSSRTAEEKESELRSTMRNMGRVLVAYSGGVDSSYLATIATQELGTDAFCVLGLSPSVSKFQRDEALATALSGGFNFLTIDTAEIGDPKYAANPQNRCYFCKSELFGTLTVLANEKGIAFVADGTNADDLMSHRPGRLAAEENGVRSPLAEVGFTKDDIRRASRQQGISGWSKPASPCLSSRISYGVPVTIRRLSQIEKAEEMLRTEGFSEFRVRVHEGLARIEIAQAEMGRALDAAFVKRISTGFKGLGFKYVTLDMEGFRSGSLNVAPEDQQRYAKIIRQEQLEKV